MTSSHGSDISSDKYGYDFVVATTQASINATMKQFLDNQTDSLVAVCYVADATGTGVPIAYDALKTIAKGSDPFTIPNGTDPATSPDIQNLISARFLWGFNAQIGLPPMSDPSKIPKIVSLGADTSAVVFNLLCSEFIAVELQFSPYSSTTWFSGSQEIDHPLVFTSKVDLRLSLMDSSAYSHLPPDVQAKIKNLGDQAFSVQQLLFDLSNASLMSIPTFTGPAPSPKLLQFLQTNFLGTYFAHMAKEGQPLLSAAIVKHNAASSTLTLTDLNFETQPYLDPGTGLPIPSPTPEEQDLATLNYLCAADRKKLPPPVRFTWNWIDASETGDHNGVIAINRNTLASYFHNHLSTYATTNSVMANVRTWLSGQYSDLNWDWKFTNNQTPTVTFPSDGSTVLQYVYQSDAHDQAGLGGIMSEIHFKPSYTLSVSFQGSTIVVNQHSQVYCYIRAYQTSGDGNFFDKTIVDTYHLGISGSGALVVAFDPKVDSVVKDNSVDPHTNAFLNAFTNINGLVADVKKAIAGFTETNLTHVPIATMQDFVFPGGQTFVFKGVGFSNHQDLVSFITYAEPKNGVVTIPKI